MFRRLMIWFVALALVVVLIIGVLVRQLVFGGTPTLHRSSSEPTVAASPCATITPSSGLRVFLIETQQSVASYQAHFLVEGQTVPGTVVGITGDVSGEFLLTANARPTITALKIIIDLRTLNSGSAERDDHVRSDTLEVNKYPYALFTAENALVLSGSYMEGKIITFQLKGYLTMHGVTRPTTFTMHGQIVGERVSGSATALIHLQDFHMKTPMTTAAVTITVSQDILLTIHFMAQRASCSHLQTSS